MLGLEVDDIDTVNDRVTFRPNRWRRLKTPRSARTIKLWPQLKEILQPYLNEYEHKYPTGTLLFPSYVGGQEQMLTDVRKIFKAWHGGRSCTK